MILNTQERTIVNLINSYAKLMYLIKEKEDKRRIVELERYIIYFVNELTNDDNKSNDILRIVSTNYNRKTYAYMIGEIQNVLLQIQSQES